MASKDTATNDTFGRHLARLRKAAGFTQEELATEIGATRRVIAYYETESQYPPADLLLNLATALNVSLDTLMGMARKPKAVKPSSRIERRIKNIETLGPRAKRQIVQLIDTFIEAERIKQKANA